MADDDYERYKDSEMWKELGIQEAKKKKFVNKVCTDDLCESSNNDNISIDYIDLDECDIHTFNAKRLLTDIYGSATINGVDYSIVVNYDADLVTKRGPTGKVSKIVKSDIPDVC